MCVCVCLCASVCVLLALHYFFSSSNHLYERVEDSLPFSINLTEVHGSSQCRGNNTHKQFNEFIFEFFFVFSFLCYLLALLLLRSRSLFIYLPWAWLENNPCSLTTNVHYTYIQVERLNVTMAWPILAFNMYCTWIHTRCLKVRKKPWWSGANSFK